MYKEITGTGKGVKRSTETPTASSCLILKLMATLFLRTLVAFNYIYYIYQLIDGEMPILPRIYILITLISPFQFLLPIITIYEQFKVRDENKYHEK